MARAALKALGRRRRTITDVFMSFLPSSEPSDSDRATALVKCSALEDALESAILSKFVSLSKTDFAQLFEGDNPLATFSAKIKLGFALGLYGSQTRADLNCIRNIRNAFAHARMAISFDTPEVAEPCRDLQRKHDDAPLAENASPREHYVTAVDQLSIDLLQLRYLAQGVKPKASLP